MSTFRTVLGATALFVIACSSSTPEPDRSLPDNYSELKLSWSGGFVLMDADAAAECPNPSGSYTLTRATRELSWTSVTCTGDATSNRTLSETELSSVQAAFDQIKTGSRVGCGWDKPLVTLDLTVDGTTQRYVDNFYSGCEATTRAWANPDGRTWVMDVDPLHSVLHDLCDR